MQTALKMNLIAHPLTPCIGGEIRVDPATLLNGDVSQEVLGLLEERGVLCFPDVWFSDDQQMAFTRTLGAIHSEAKGGVMKVSTDKQANGNPILAEYQKSSIYWHVDGVMDEIPMRAVMMSPRVLPDMGTATEFANLYAAYDELPDVDKELIDNLRVVHNFETVMRMVTPWPTYGELRSWQKARPSRYQPLVWRHRSGRKSLLLGASASHIEGMSLEEGRALLCRLHEWSTQQCYLYRHEWKMGELLMWNNTGVLHRAVPYPLDSMRVMHRTSVVGEDVPT
jgi:alpha-ketoglutarate-dependent taurine dioxygenase